MKSQKLVSKVIPHAVTPNTLERTFNLPKCQGALDLQLLQLFFSSLYYGVYLKLQCDRDFECRGHSCYHSVDTKRERG